MPTERVPLQRPRRGHVTNAQWWELLLGPGGKSVFEDRQQLKDAWERAREKMMASLSPGRRPLAYYEFEFAGRRPPYDTERSVLWRMNLLRADERVALEAEWKAEFEKAQASDFMLSVSEDEILKGDYARAAHYRWADVPDKLLRKWTTAERRRRARARGAAQETAPGAVSSAEG